MTKRVAFRTIGCKLNQYESDALAARFRAAGWDVVPPEEPAHCYVVNTCTVTNRSDRKSRNQMNRAIRMRERARELPQGLPKAERGSSGGSGALRDRAFVVMTGCYVDSHSEIAARDERVYAVGNTRKHAIVQLAEAHMRGEVVRPDRLPEGVFDFVTPDRTFHTRSMLKVQDGCDNFCSFCIVPLVRGTARSRPFAEVRDELRASLDAGYRELVVTGVNISRYDDEGLTFSRLVERLLEEDGDFRLRISSLEPDQLDERFFDLFAHPKMCPHLHLCLQSASERILLRMRRQYTARGFREIAEHLRNRYPGFNLTTDILVGFPGETEADFAETCRMAQELGFSHIHTFPYSIRDGTRAARMPDQVPQQTKAERAEIIRGISAENKRRYRASRVGTRERLLVEQARESRATGYGEHYLPIRLAECAARPNTFVDVELDALEEGDDPPLRARPVPEASVRGTADAAGRPGREGAYSSLSGGTPAGEAGARALPRVRAE